MVGENNEIIKQAIVNGESLAQEEFYGFCQILKKKSQMKASELLLE